jgi:hypothetical protein
MRARQASVDEVEAACRELNCGGLNDLLGAMDAELPELFTREAELEGGDVRLLLHNWLENIEADSRPSYVPLQVYISLFDAADWTEPRLRGAADLIELTRRLHSRLTD